MPSDDETSERVPREAEHPVCTGGVLPDDLYDYYGSVPEPRRRSPRARDAKTWHVTDDWPERVPVTEAEIEVFERWFADLFDELFGLTGR